MHSSELVSSLASLREALGIMKCVVSGGGSLAAHLDDFYEAAGLPVLVRCRRWPRPPCLSPRVDSGLLCLMCHYRGVRGGLLGIMYTRAGANPWEN